MSQAVAKQFQRLQEQVATLQQQINVLAKTHTISIAKRPSRNSPWQNTAGVMKKKLKNVDPVKLQRQWRKEWAPRQ